MDTLRKLNSVGKRAFIENFDLFKDYAAGRITRETAIKKLVNMGVSNESGAAIRVGNAKLIFDNQCVLEALNLVLESRRMPADVIAEAKKLINKTKNSG